MKTPLLVCLLTFGMLSVFAQTSFQAEDIQGEWQSKAGYYITITKSVAKVSSMGNTGFPKKLLGDTFFGEITHTGNNTWSARRYQWKFTDDNPENGRWADEGLVTLNMNADKTSFSEGTRVFVRTAPARISVVENKGSNYTKNTITEDFGGVAAHFQLIGKPGGGSFIVAQFTNKTQDAAVVRVLEANGTQTSGQISPGGTLTKKYDSASSITVEVELGGTGKENTDTGMIEKVKQVIRKTVTRENETIKLGPAPAIGIRG